MAGEETILVNVSVEVNDDPVTIEGNSVSFKEGTGDSTVKAASKGGKTVMVSSEDITTKVGMIKFDMPTSIASIDTSRSWGVAGSGQVVKISGTDAAGNRFGRTMTQALNTNDPDKVIQNEGKLTVEFHGSPLIPS